MSPKPKVLVVDDEEALLKALSMALTRAGCEVVSLTDPIEASIAAKERGFEVALLDIALPNLTGIDLLKEIKNTRPELEVIMMTGDATASTALAAVKAGAYDYLTKPFESLEHVVLTVTKACERKRMLDRNRMLEGMLEAKEHFEDFIGQSPAMTSVFKLIEAVAASSATVLIRGQSGTGKELVARAIHRLSARKNKSFLAINCSALTDTLLESELFGHVKGAFTGAVSNAQGLFAAADGGTLFLDEIGDISPQTQVRLLRVLQEGEVRPVGSREVVHVDTRVIAATNVNLEDAKAEGRFREDLYYRLNVIVIELPPLKDRLDDIPLLAHHFVRKHAAKMGKEISGLSNDFLQALMSYAWPGNVRELENVIERAVVFTPGGSLSSEVLPASFKSSGVDDSRTSLSHLPYARAKELAMRAFERRYLSTLMNECKGVISAAARKAQLDRSNFRRLLKQHDMAGNPESEKNEAEELPPG
ncbi:MAG: sigma-54-dependent transcriptional regulator [Myxococcota bacterium]